jgi:hypothetical protein
VWTEEREGEREMRERRDGEIRGGEVFTLLGVNVVTGGLNYICLLPLHRVDRVKRGRERKERWKSSTGISFGN